MARLEFEGKSVERDDIDLDGKELSMGRDPSNSLSYNDPWLSRFHARIHRKLGHFYLEDLGSRNGTYLNGGRIRSKLRLKHGDLVALGELELRFVVERSSLPEEESLPPESTVLISSEELTYDRFAPGVVGRNTEDTLVPKPAAEREHMELLPALHSVAAALITDYPLSELTEVVLELALRAVDGERGAILLRDRWNVAQPTPTEALRIPKAPTSRLDSQSTPFPMPPSQQRHRRSPSMVPTQPIRRPTGGFEVPAIGDDEPGSDLVLNASFGFVEGEEVQLSRTLLKEVLSNGKAVLTLDAQTDERFGEAISIQMAGIRSILCVPLWNNREVIGVLYLDQRFSGMGFNENDLRLLGLIANMAAVKIENVYLQQENIEKQRLEEQLAVGAKIQSHLLPSESPKIDGYDLFGANHSCYDIGGDYYDFIPLRDGRWAVVLADVAGKGVGAALLMAVLQASLRTLSHIEVEPAALVARLNRVLVNNSPSNKFATLFYGELDPVNHVLEYVNGGHIPAGLLTNGGSVNQLEPTGPVVGLVEEAEFTSRRLQLGARSSLLVCTDGVTEQTNGEGEEFGLDRLRRFAQSKVVNAQSMGENLHRRLVTFCGGQRFSDDSTLLIVRRLAE